MPIHRAVHPPEALDELGSGFSPAKGCNIETKVALQHATLELSRRKIAIELCPRGVNRFSSLNKQSTFDPTDQKDGPRETAVTCALSG